MEKINAGSAKLTVYETITVEETKVRIDQVQQEFKDLLQRLKDMKAAGCTIPAGYDKSPDLVNICGGG